MLVFFKCFYFPFTAFLRRQMTQWEFNHTSLDRNTQQTHQDVRETKAKRPCESWPVYGQVSDSFIVIQKHKLKWSEWKHADSLMLKHYSSCWFNAFSCSRRSTFLCLRVIWQMFYLPFKIFSIFLRLLNSFGLNSYCLVGITHVIYENVAMLQE